MPLSAPTCPSRTGTGGRPQHTRTAFRQLPWLANSGALHFGHVPFVSKSQKRLLLPALAFTGLSTSAQGTPSPLLEVRCHERTSIPPLLKERLTPNVQVWGVHQYLCFLPSLEFQTTNCLKHMILGLATPARSCQHPPWRDTFRTTPSTNPAPLTESATVGLGSTGCPLEEQARLLGYFPMSNEGLAEAAEEPRKRSPLRSNQITNVRWREMQCEPIKTSRTTKGLELLRSD
jgi:hypothetical protein